MMNLRFTSALLLAAFAVLPSVTQSHPLKDTATAREQQWLFREALGEGTQMPTAVFLSWDYSRVILTATCDLKSTELVVRNHLQADDKLPELFTIKIASQAGIVSLRTVRHDRVLEGRTKITSDVVAVLSARGDLEIDLPNEMGEPIYVGQAEPLRRLVQMCR
jgi:hypothetical protein